MQRVKNIVFDKLFVEKRCRRQYGRCTETNDKFVEHDVNFIACSATISEPEEHIGKIVEKQTCRSYQSIR